MSKWKEYKLSELANIVMGQSPPSSSYNEENLGLPFLQGCADFGDTFPITKYYCTEPKKIAPINSILISVRAPVGLTNLSNRTFVIGRGLAAIVPNNTDLMFLYYSIHQNTSNLDRVSQGSTFTAINSDELNNFKLLAPLIHEQRKIAHILSTTDSVIEKTQQAIDKYKAIKQGMLQDLFTRGIDIKTGKLRPRYEEAPELYKESKLGWIPNEWELKIFGKEIDLVHGHQFRNYDFTEYGVPVVKIGQVKPENVDLSNCSYVSTGRMEEFKDETIRNGDVLMALTGATLGKACLVSGLSNPVLQNYRVGRFEPIIKEKYIDKVFLYYILIAAELLTQIFNKVNSGAQGNIGKADFEKATFKKPPFDEQKLIAQRLISIDNKLKSEEFYFHKLQMLKSGLMSDLLSGKKRVKVDNEDLSKTV